MKVKRFIFLLFVLLFVSPVFASEESHMAAAKKMVELANLDKTIQDMHQQIRAAIYQSLITKDPCLKPIQGAVSDVVARYDQKILNTDIVKTEIQKVYKEHFTEEEIERITTFYQTPAGKKALEKAPLLATKGLQIAQQQINESKDKGIMEELQKEIAKLVDNIDPNSLTAECRKKYEDKKAHEKTKASTPTSSLPASTPTTEGMPISNKPQAAAQGAEKTKKE